MFTILTAHLACTVSESYDSQVLDVAGLKELQIDVEQGDVSYRGGYSQLTMDVRSWGSAREDVDAVQRQEGNSWGMDRSGPTAHLWARSSSWSAGTEMDVVGPSGLQSEFVLEDGDLDLRDLSGATFIQAQDVLLYNVSGDVEILASSSVDASLAPGAGDVIRIVADGPIELELPWSRGYDLQVWASTESELWIEDFGFHHSVTEPGYFAGLSGDAAVRVIIETNSSVRVTAF